MPQKSTLRVLLQPIAIAIILAAAVRLAVRLYVVPSASMAPTLVAGDHIVVTPYWRSAPKRGDVIVFRSPASSREWLVKRVVAVPGDLIDTRLGNVRIGGYTKPEPYVERHASSGQIPALVVPPDSYYVMGDNRDVSYDSRAWGAVPRSFIAGRARMVLWSSNRSTGVRAASALGPAGGLRIFKCIE